MFEIPALIPIRSPFRSPCTQWPSFGMYIFLGYTVVGVTLRLLAVLWLVTVDSCHCITVLWFHPELSFWIPRSLKQTRIQKSVLKKSSKTGKNRLENSSLNFLETLIYGWNLRTFRFFRMSSFNGQGEKVLNLFSFKLVRRNKNEKIVCLNGSNTKGLLLPLQKVLQNCSHKDLKKKKKKDINKFILRFMIHKMFWIHMYLQCLANWLVVLKFVTVGFCASTLVFFIGVSKGLE